MSIMSLTKGFPECNDNDDGKQQASSSKQQQRKRISNNNNDHDIWYNSHLTVFLRNRHIIIVSYTILLHVFLHQKNTQNEASKTSERITECINNIFLCVCVCVCVCACEAPNYIHVKLSLQTTNCIKFVCKSFRSNGAQSEKIVFFSCIVVMFVAVFRQALIDNWMAEHWIETRSPFLNSLTLSFAKPITQSSTQQLVLLAQQRTTKTTMMMMTIGLSWQMNL